MRIRQLVRELEELRALDPVAEKVSGVVTSLSEAKPVKNVLTGRWLGHPVHPLLTDLPIGAWSGAAVLDLLAGPSAASGADALIAFGIAAAVPTAATGAADWADYNDQRAQRVGLVHAVANSVAMSLYVASLAARRRGRRGAGVGLSLAGLAVLSAGGYLGGHLAYGLGSGVDHTAFEELPDEWEDALSEAKLVPGEPRVTDAGEVEVVLVKQDGRIHALADRCNHMGGPLHEGDLVDGCIRCPWHGSTFRLEDGEVVRGPASVSQPSLETRVDGGRVQVRAAPRS